MKQGTDMESQNEPVMPMKPRERIRAALNYMKTDRIPIGAGGCAATGIHIDAYIELGKYLELDVEYTRMNDQYMCLARIEEPVRRRLHGDIICLEATAQSWGYARKDWKPWKTGVGNVVLVPGAFDCRTEGAENVLYDRDGKAVARQPVGGLYFDKICATDIRDDIPHTDTETFRRSIPLYTDEELKQLEHEARFLHEHTDCAIQGAFDRAKFWSSGVFAGHPYGEWLVLLMTEPDYCAEILDVASAQSLKNVEMYLQATGRYIDVITMSTTDYGSQRGEIFNPDIFRDLYVPALKRVNDHVHRNSRAKTFYHCCGSIANTLEHFIASGADIINPVQCSAANMEPGNLVKRYGGRVIFWGGGSEVQSTMQMGTASEVAEEVKRRIDAFAPTRGFVFTPTHNIQYGTPPKNIVTAFDAAFNYKVA